MTFRSLGRTTRGAALTLLVSAILLGACGGSGTPRPTDPRAILVGSIAATAALPTLRIHAELASNVGAMVNAPNAVVTMAIDADVDLATRQFAGRATTQLPPMLAGNGALAQQVSDMIVTQTATFNRDSRTGRWMKLPADGGAFGGGPTNAQVAAMLSALASNPATVLEFGEASPCTLGTCDHVVAHIDSRTLSAALGPLIGVPVDAIGAGAIPDLDLDILVDEATAVISEVRTEFSIQGTSVRILLTVSNPGQPVQIAPPPPALTDDFGPNLGGGFGGGGGVGPIPAGPVPSGILEEVGNSLATPVPMDPAASPGAP